MLSSEIGSLRRRRRRRRRQADILQLYYYDRHEIIVYAENVGLCRVTHFS